MALESFGKKVYLSKEGSKNVLDMLEGPRIRMDKPSIVTEPVIPAYNKDSKRKKNTY